MGVRRHSTNPFVRRRQEQLDRLQWLCRIYGDPITIGDIISGDVHRAQWRCRNPECFHRSEAFDLSRFGRKVTVTKLRWKFVCSVCGFNRPDLELLWEDVT